MFSCLLYLNNCLFKAMHLELLHVEVILVITENSLSDQWKLLFAKCCSRSIDGELPMLLYINWPQILDRIGLLKMIT